MATREPLYLNFIYEVTSYMTSLFVFLPSYHWRQSCSIETIKAKRLSIKPVRPISRIVQKVIQSAEFLLSRHISLQPRGFRSSSQLFTRRMRSRRKGKVDCSRYVSLSGSRLPMLDLAAWQRSNNSGSLICWPCSFRYRSRDALSCPNKRRYDSSTSSR